MNLKKWYKETSWGPVVGLRLRKTDRQLRDASNRAAMNRRYSYYILRYGRQLERGIAPTDRTIPADIRRDFERWAANITKYNAVADGSGRAALYEHLGALWRARGAQLDKRDALFADKVRNLATKKRGKALGPV